MMKNWEQDLTGFYQKSTDHKREAATLGSLLYRLHNGSGEHKILKLKEEDGKLVPQNYLNVLKKTENENTAKKTKTTKTTKTIHGIEKQTTKETADQIQQGIAKEILRFHVLANSDSQADQALKYAVRDRVGTMMAEKLQNVDSLEESTDVVTENLQEIETCAAKVIGENGYDYPVHAALETCAFPEKSYGDYTFPSGTYEALRVVIGSGEGHNWWCVMYPNLCFANSMYEVDSASGEKMREVLEPEEYAAVLESGNYKVRFKMLGFLNRMLE